MGNVKTSSGVIPRLETLIDAHDEENGGNLICPACKSRCKINKCLFCSHRWLPPKMRQRIDYSRIGNRNPAQNQYLQKKTKERVDFLSRFISDGMSILEIGCAEGAIGRTIKSRSKVFFFGAEPSPDRDIANGALDDVRVSAEEYYAAKRKFDLIISFHVLEHIPDAIDTLRLWNTLLAEDGKVIIEVPNGSGHKDVLTDLNPEHVHQFSVSSLCLHASSAGLDVEWLTTGNYESPVYSDSIRMVAKKRESDSIKFSRLKERFKNLGPKFGIYGLGGDFRNYVRPAIAPDQEVVFIDSKVTDLSTQGIRASASQYDRSAHQNLRILVSTIHNAESIIQDLLKEGHPPQKIIQLSDLMS
jgi:2-polyprenyl-3-methyl-5-hydroxy-6-metoxy-1,4-benzoquinol methylase